MNRGEGYRDGRVGIGLLLDVLNGVEFGEARRSDAWARPRENSGSDANNAAVKEQSLNGFHDNNHHNTPAARPQLPHHSLTHVVATLGNLANDSELTLHRSASRLLLSCIPRMRPAEKAARSIL